MAKTATWALVFDWTHSVEVCEHDTRTIPFPTLTLAMLPLLRKPGRFFEPYYLVFAREDQLLDTPQLSSTTVGGTHSPAAREGLRLVRHTIPHFVPLESLVEKYLPLLLGGAESGGSSSSNTSDGGLALLQDFQQLPGLEVSKLQSNLVSGNVD